MGGLRRLRADLVCSLGSSRDIGRQTGIVISRIETDTMTDDTVLLARFSEARPSCLKQENGTLFKQSPSFIYDV